MKRRVARAARATLEKKSRRPTGFVNLSVDESDAYWSGFHQNNRLIGQKAVDLIVGMLQRGERGIPEIPVRTLIESSWKEGKTLSRQGKR